MKKFNFVMSGLFLLMASAIGQTYLVPEEGYRVAYYFPDYQTIGAFDVHENLLFIHDGDTIHMVDGKTGEEFKKFGEPADYSVANYVSFLTVSPDGKSLWTGYTSDGNVDDRIYSIEMESGAWKEEARFPGNFDLIFWNDSILISGLNSATWGDPSGIFILDTSGQDLHRKIIEVGGNSSGMAIDTGNNLYLGTSYSVDPNAIYKWTRGSITPVIESPGSAPLQISDGQKLTDIPAGAYDLELDTEENLIFNMNQFGSSKVMAIWNGTWGDGYNLDTLAVAYGDWDWLGTLKSVGDFTKPYIGDKLITFSFGKGMTDLHTANYPPVFTGPIQPISGYENSPVEAIDLTQFVVDPDDAGGFVFELVEEYETDVIDPVIQGDSLTGTYGTAGQVNLFIVARSGDQYLTMKMVAGVWPEITGEYLVSDFEDLSLEPDNYWNGSDGSGRFNSASAEFSNVYDPEWFSWGGWAYSSVSDNTTPGWMNQYSAITGTGFDRTMNYSVSYASSPAVVGFTEDKAHAVEGFFVTNSTYAALSMENGDDFTKKFGGDEGTDPDFFKLDVWGTKDGSDTDTIAYYLADFRSEAPDLDYIIQTWQWVDLTSLGKVDSLQFVLSSSDVGDWGMNTPGYFCLDNLYVIPDGAPYVANPIPDMVILSDGSDGIIDISSLFSDPDDEDDSIDKVILSNSNEELLDATIEGDELILLSKLQVVKSLWNEAEIVIEGMSGGLSVRDTFMVTVDFVEAIGNRSEVLVEVYPNPTSGSFVVGANTQEPLNVTVLSISGARIYENMEFVSGETIDISHMPAGAYMIRIIHQDGITSKMIQKL